MLYVLSDGTIRLTRGDTARLIVPIVNRIPGQEEVPYTIKSTDILELSIKKSVKDDDSLVHKEIVGSNIFHILPTDTKNLSFGKYVYDVQLTTDNDIYTVVEPSTFEIMKEVT